MKFSFHIDWRDWRIGLRTDFARFSTLADDCSFTLPRKVPAHVDHREIMIQPLPCVKIILTSNRLRRCRPVHHRPRRASR